MAGGMAGEGACGTGAAAADIREACRAREASNLATLSEKLPAILRRLSSTDARVIGVRPFGCGCATPEALGLASRGRCSEPDGCGEGDAEKEGWDSDEEVEGR